MATIAAYSPPPRVTRFTYGANSLLDNDKCVKRLLDAINNGARFEINNENMNNRNNNMIETCLIVYETQWDDETVKHARAMTFGGYFDFSCQISKICYDDKVVSNLDVFMKIYSLMDSGAPSFVVEQRMFGRGFENATSDAELDLHYKYKRGRFVTSGVKNGSVFYFGKSEDS